MANPLKPLDGLNLVNQLITEHGSAAIQKTHLELLRDWIKKLDSDKKELTKDVAELRETVKILTTTNQRLTTENEELIAQRKGKPTVRLSDMEQGMLIWLSEMPDGINEDQIISHFHDTKPERMRYHLERLVESEFIDKSIDRFEQWHYRLTQAGRHHLFKRGAL
jgi:regulator of replication initiation timing